MTGRAGDESGSISVVAAGVMVVMAVLAMGCADVAQTYAAQELALPGGAASPSDAAADYAERDGGELVSCDCDPGAREATVEVRVPVGNLWLFGTRRVVTARARADVDLPG